MIYISFLSMLMNSDITFDIAYDLNLLQSSCPQPQGYPISVYFIVYRVYHNYLETITPYHTSPKI